MKFRDDRISKASRRIKERFALLKTTFGYLNGSLSANQRILVNKYGNYFLSGSRTGSSAISTNMSATEINNYIALGSEAYAKHLLDYSAKTYKGYEKGQKNNKNLVYLIFQRNSYSVKNASYVLRTVLTKHEGAKHFKVKKRSVKALEKKYKNLGVWMHKHRRALNLDENGSLTKDNVLKMLALAQREGFGEDYEAAVVSASGEASGASELSQVLSEVIEVADVLSF